MSNKEKIEGKVGFDKRETQKEIVSKEETMFRVDKDGKAIPETYTINIYDRGLDKELIIEAELLMSGLKREKATDKMINEAVTKDKAEIEILKTKLSKETDENKKKVMELQLVKETKINNLEEMKTRINVDILEEETKESRELIKELKGEIEKQKKEKYIEIVPCTTSEAYLAFEKGLTIEGKPSNDWVSDLISKKCINPKYTLDEAKKLKPDYKIAIKEAIATISNYKTQSYRDIIMERKLSEEKPLTKKERPMS